MMVMNEKQPFVCYIIGSISSKCSVGQAVHKYISMLKLSCRKAFLHMIRYNSHAYLIGKCQMSKMSNQTDILEIDGHPAFDHLPSFTTSLRYIFKILPTVYGVRKHGINSY